MGGVGSGPGPKRSTSTPRTSARVCCSCRRIRSRRGGCSIRRSTPYGHFAVRINRYSVPVCLIGKQVRVLLHASHLMVYDRNVEVAWHERLIAKASCRLELDHYLEVLIRKPGAFPGATALNQAGSAGKFTPAHDAWWAAAVRTHSHTDGTRRRPGRGPCESGSRVGGLAPSDVSKFRMLFVNPGSKSSARSGDRLCPCRPWNRRRSAAEGCLSAQPCQAVWPFGLRRRAVTGAPIVSRRLPNCVAGIDAVRWFPIIHLARYSDMCSTFRTDRGCSAYQQRTSGPPAVAAES